MATFRAGAGPASALLCEPGPATTSCGLDLLLSEVGWTDSETVKRLFRCSLELWPVRRSGPAAEVGGRQVWD